MYEVYIQIRKVIRYYLLKLKMCISYILVFIPVGIYAREGLSMYSWKHLKCIKHIHAHTYIQQSKNTAEQKYWDQTRCSSGNNKKADKCTVDHSYKLYSGSENDQQPLHVSPRM